MSQLILDPVLSGYNLAKVNDNFKRIEEAFNTLLLHKDGSKALTSDLDVNSQKLLNVGGIEIGGVDLLESISSLQAAYSAYISEMETYRSAVEGILEEAVSYGAVDKKSIGNSQAILTTTQAYAKDSNLTLPLKYIVGKNTLRLSLGHTYLLYKGVDYEEVGVVGEESQTIKILRTLGIGVGATIEQVVDGDNDLYSIYSTASSLQTLLTTSYPPDKIEQFINSVSDVKELGIEDKISELWDIYNNLSALQVSFAQTVADINTKYSTITDMYDDIGTKYSLLETLYPQLVALIADTDFNLDGLNAAVADMLTAIQDLKALTNTVEPNAQIASTAATSASTSAGEASNNASIASASATKAQIWAEGTDTEVGSLLGEHSSKGWAEEAKRYATGNIIEALGYTPADVYDLNALDDSVVKHTEQTLTSTQQAQARTNIGAASSSDLSAEAQARQSADTTNATEISNLGTAVSNLATVVEGKQNTLTFDSTPTANSSNPVTSGGIKTALDEKLSLTGGEMTGNVVVSGRTKSGGITTVVSSGQYAKGVNPPETEWHLLAVAVEEGDYTVADSTENSKRYGFVETAVESDGSVYTQIAAIKNLAGNSDQVKLRVGWDSAGNAFAEAAGHEVERINSSGSNWIRYESGLQMVWMSVNVTTDAVTMTFPVAFSGSPIVTVGSNSAVVAFVTSLSSTGGTVNLASYGSTSRAVRVFAIGKWK